MLDVCLYAISRAVFAVPTIHIGIDFEVGSVVHKVGVCAEIYVPQVPIKRRIVGYRQFLSAKDNVGSPFAFLTRFVVFVAFAVLQVRFDTFILAVKVHEGIKRAKAFVAFAAAF